MHFNFSDRVRAVLAMAREAAFRLQHDYVGTEHLLLGVLQALRRAEHSPLDALGVVPEDVKARVEEVVKPGNAKLRLRELPYTSRAKKAIELAMAEAREVGATVVGTEHMLAGLVREEKGIAARVLREFGVTVEALRGGSRAQSRAGTRHDLQIEVDDASDLSIYEQIVARIKEAIATGELNAGDRLPAVRALADRLDIAPGTVVRSYGELERLGLVVTQGSRGTRVAAPAVSTRGAPFRPDVLAGLLRPVAVAAYHMGATAEDLRRALREAMSGIYVAEGEGEGAQEG